MREKGPGLGTSQIEEPTGALGQRSPAPVPQGSPPQGWGAQRAERQGSPQSQRTPVPHPPRPTGTWSTGRQAPDARGSLEHSREATGCREGASGPSGLTPGSGSFFHSTEEAPAQGLEARPRFPEVQDSGLVGGQQQGPTAVHPPAGVSRPRAPASHGTQRGLEPIWWLGAVGFGDARPLYCLRPFTHLGHTSPFCPWAPPAGAWSSAFLENVLK